VGKQQAERSARGSRGAHAGSSLLSIQEQGSGEAGTEIDGIEKPVGALLLRALGAPEAAWL